MKYIVWLSLLLSSQSYASLLTKIDIFQQGALLTFKVNFENTDSRPVILQLTSKAQITQYGNIKLSKTDKGHHQIQLMHPLTGFIHYQIPIDLKKSYFLAGSDVWHPFDSKFPLQSTYQISSSLQTGYELSHSATGFQQTDVAYTFGAFKKYEAQDKRLKILLAKEDSALAATLLQNLKKYLDHYESSIGEYPYDSFTVIEAPDEIGFAFPKMTWIGSQLLRFPFILKTSLPHELLHSWWGTSVFVDYEKGNWCEGLTTFGADYGLLTSEEKKLYRIKALTSYLNYVSQSQELSLSQFTSRGEDRSLQALGYDKALMVFVMLEQVVGEKNFSLGLKTFYSDFKFKKASWSDFFSVMTKISGQDLKSFQNYWVKKPGFISQNFLTLKKNQNKIDVTGMTSEFKKMPGFKIQTLIQTGVEFKNLVLQISPKGSGVTENQFHQFPKANHYSIDPEFYLFRDLGINEKPLNFSEFFGSQNILYNFSESLWTEALQSVFPNKKWTKFSSTIDWDSSQTLIMDFQTAFKNLNIKTKLLEKGIVLQGFELNIEKQKINLNEQAVFISLRINSSNVVIMNLNSQLPLQRWLQRWSRYGGQSYVVLNNTSASLQGVWVDLFKVPLE